jgi:protein NirF
LAGLAGCAPPRGTGDLGIVIARDSGAVVVVDTTKRAALARVGGLGDLSHAAAVFSRDQRYAFVAGRDGALTKVDILAGRIVKRVQQAGNSIGVSISEDGRLIAVQNYEPGGVKVFDAESLEQLADIPTNSRVVGLADAPGNIFVFSLFDAGEIWVADLSDPRRPAVKKYPNVGRQPYDGLVTTDGRFYIAGLFGEDGVALLDLWHQEAGVRRILDGYRKGDPALPVYKMPHLRGWAEAGSEILMPAIGAHEVLVVDAATWTEKARIPVAGQPVFVVVRPGGREAWVTFAVPDYGKVQVIDLPSRRVADTLEPGKAILHLEFLSRGGEVWMSARDDNRVLVYDAASRKRLAEIEMQQPSGIFFTARAHRIGM